MPSLCYNNLTIAVYDRVHPRIFAISGNRLTGFIGTHYDAFYAPREGERSCRFISTHHFRGPIEGVSANKSLVNLVKQQLVDFYSRPDDIGHASELLESSQPVMSEPFHVAQLIKRPEPEKADFSAFIIQNHPLIFKGFLGYSFTMIALLILLKTVYSKTYKQFGFPPQQLLFLESKTVELFYPRLGCIILSFELFSFVILAMLSNSIKTQKVVVNTDQLIDTAAKFEGTTKLPCFFREEDLQIVLSAPANSFLSRIFNGKIRADLCTLSKKYNPAEVAKIKRDGYDRYFYFMKRTTLLILLSYLTRIKDARQFLVFRKPASYYEMLYVIYVRRSLEPDRKSSLFERISKAGEAGLFENMFYRIEKGLVGSLLRRIDVYESLEDFVYDYTKIEIVQLENYQKIFSYLALLLSGLLVSFIRTKAGRLRKKGYTRLARLKK